MTIIRRGVPVALSLLLLLVILMPGCASGEARGKAAPVDPLEVAWMAAQLQNKRLQLTEKEELWGPHAEPYELIKLIEWAPQSVPYLVALLQDERPTDVKYYTCPWSDGAFPLDTPERTATVGDVADYALCWIYDTDVGFRSYLPPQERLAAIERWKLVVKRSVR